MSLTRFGVSSESHIAQPTAIGDAELITLMRFKRDAAFTLVVPKTKGLPINTSLLVPGSTVVRSKDYRRIDSILALKNLPYTNWGLVVKIDSSEAFAPVAEVRVILSIAFCASILLVLASWLIYLRPLAQRLSQASQAAGRVAAGDYAFQIADKTGDEISDVSDSIDRLAADLSRDIALRSEAERRLKYQATHDELTGLFNRKYGGGLIEKIDTLKFLPDTGVLFMDPDGFAPFTG